MQIYQLANGKSMATHVHNNIVKMYRPAEIRPAPSVNGQHIAPPNVVSAPQPIKPAQSVNAAQTSTPPFREDIPKNPGHYDAVGTHVSETATPQPQVKKTDSRPYEWDVNRPVPQPPKPEPAPAPRPQAPPPPRQITNVNNPLPQQQRLAPQPQSRPATSHATEACTGR